MLLDARIVSVWGSQSTSEEKKNLKKTRSIHKSLFLWPEIF